MLMGYRTFLLNLAAVLGVVAIDYTLDPMNGVSQMIHNPIVLALLIGGLNLAKRFLAPTQAPPV